MEGRHSIRYFFLLPRFFARAVGGLGQESVCVIWMFISIVSSIPAASPSGVACSRYCQPMSETHVRSYFSPGS